MIRSKPTLAPRSATVPLRNHSRPLRLGFVPLNDSAPLIMASELGLFAKYRLSVELSRELGWATIRDKIIYGELDAAHALAAMPVAATFGLGSMACDCLTGLVLSLNGNAITLSSELWKRGVRDAKTLRNEIIRARGRKTYTFGVVSLFSSHNFLMRQWLGAGGLNPDRDVRIVVVPPPQMYVNLKAGNLDGYCVGEPWNSVAVQNNVGWCVTTSSQLAPFHPEKVLLTQTQFAREREPEHLAMIAALIEACAFCDDPAHHDQLVATLAQPHYINAPVESVRSGLAPLFNFGNGRTELVPDFNVFHRYDTNEPTLDKAAWVVNHLLHSGVVKDPSVINPTTARQVFRADIFQQAKALVESSKPNEFKTYAETQLVPA